jgi:hypothetical protein
MLAFLPLLLFAALLGAAGANDARAAAKTVCTITVNSPDEQATFQRYLPKDKFEFVELVERGRPDWLASACRRQIRCDVLVISGHYDGGNEFFSDRVDKSEYLPVDEMERVSCSESCPGLFSQLKEVYLFGCNTLNPGANNSASAEIERSLLRSGHSPADAGKLARALSSRHAESSRDRMRLVFVNVPAIYGFASVAPVGPAAASILGRYFQSAGTGEVGGGRASSRLLGQFSPQGMTVTNGLTDTDAQFAFRRDVCRFVDDRPPEQKLAFVHGLLGREAAEVRLFLDRIEEYIDSLPASQRDTPAVAKALDDIAHDRSARDRFLDFARHADRPAVRARMLKLARSLGWLSPEGLKDELIAMLAEQLARESVSAADVDLACTLNDAHELDGYLDRLRPPPTLADKAGHSAILACLGSSEARARVLAALAGSDERAVESAQVYLQHRPLTDVTETRAVVNSIVVMTSPAAQIRALDALAGLHLSDRPSLEELVRLFRRTGSADVQTAIAGVLIRADYRALAAPEVVQTLRNYRLQSLPGDDLIDVLIRRLQMS